MLRTRYVIEIAGDDGDKLDALMDLLTEAGSERRRIDVPDPAGKPAISMLVGPGIGLRRTVLE